MTSSDYLWVAFVITFTLFLGDLIWVVMESFKDEE
jgi:hypothetical protein